MNDLEKLRSSFRPKPIMTLFVGESPPHGATFFYKENSLLYRSMKECFGDTADFLAEFKAKCFFLDDLVLHPINKIKDKKERNEHRQKAVSSLARRMAVYQPAMVVILMCAIEKMVVNAMADAGLSHIPYYVTPFPIHYHRNLFKERMSDIIPHLPACLPSTHLSGH
jgi:hypothetical protein